MLNILFLSPQNVIPPIDGGKTSIFYPVKYLAKEHNVFFAFPYKNLTVSEKQKLLNSYKEFNIDAIPINLDTTDNPNFYLKNIFNNIPFKMAKYFDKNFYEVLKQIIKNHNIDLVHVNHSHMAQYAVRLNKEFNIPITLREHNIEYLLVKQFALSHNNLFVKIGAYLEYLKTKFYERRLWNKFNHTFFISYSDLKEAMKYNKNFSEANLLYDGMDIENLNQSVEVEPDSFIFCGNLSSFQNEWNLRYFIENIWKPFLKVYPTVKLYLTGNEDEFLYKKLDTTGEELRSYNIINMGFVENVRNAILSKKYFVSPTLYGSGIRLKVLEALSLKKVVFVTEIDYSMVKNFDDMKNIVLYRNPDEFIKKYEILEENQDLIHEKIAKNGQKIISEELNWERYNNKLSKYLNKCIKPVDRNYAHN